MTDVVVWPYGVKRSMTSSRCSTSRTWTRMKKQSSPVMRWHSTTSGVARARSATLAICRGEGRMRTIALSVKPSARGSTSACTPRSTPASVRRRTRSATAGGESPTRRPSSARLRRPSTWSSTSSARSVPSSRSTASWPLGRPFAAMSTRLPSIDPSVGGSTAGSFAAMRYFVGSATFHYLGPAFAVLLFARVDVLGVAWLRIAVAAAVFAAWRRPWRRIGAGSADLRLVAAWGACLALMNCCFYLAIDRLPLATVAAIEFLPVVGLAALGARTPRNLAALVLAAGGVYALTGVHLAGGPTGLAIAFATAELFTMYIVLADRAAKRPALDGVDGLGAAMIVAALVVTPLAGWAVLQAFGDPVALAAAVGVGLSSSVIPYVCDQLALAQLPRATYSLMVSLLPAVATVIGVVVLTQIPSALDVLGVAAVAGGVALHAQPLPVSNIMDNRAPAAAPAESSTASATEAIVGSPRPSPGLSGRGSGPKPSSSTMMRSEPSSSTRASTRIRPGSRSR